MAKAPGEIKIELSAEGAQAVISALRGVENSGTKAGKAVEGAGGKAIKSFTLATAGAKKLDSETAKTSSRLTALFTGVIAGGMVISTAFGTAQAGVSGMKSVIDSLRDASIQAAEEVRNLQMLSAALQIEGDGAAAMTQGITASISSFSFDAEAGDIADMLNDLSTKAIEALQGDETAIKIFTQLGISIDDIVDKSGKLKKPVDLLYAIIDGAKGVDRALRNNALELIIGTGGVRQFAPLFDTSSTEIQDTAEELMKLGNVSDDVVKSAERVARSQQRVGLALSGAGNALLSGMSGSITEGNESFVDFLVKNQGRVESFGRVIGDFSDDIYSRLMEFADALASDLEGVGGDLANGPLKTGMDLILQVIDYILDSLEDLSGYFAKGERSVETEWIDRLVNGFTQAKDAAVQFGGGVQEFVAFIEDDVAPAVSSLYDGLVDIYEMFGITSDGAQLGLTVALLGFSSTIGAVLLNVGLLIGKLTGLGGAMTTALAAMAPAAALIAAPFVGASVGAREATIAESAADLYGRVVDVAREKGAEAGTALAIAGEEAIRKEAGRSVLDAVAGALLPQFIYMSKNERVAELQVRLKGLSREEILAEAAEGIRAAGIALDETLEIDFGAGIEITGAEINAAVQAQLAAIPATIEVTAINGIQELIADSMGGSARLAASADVGGIATTGGLTPATINFNGQPVGQVYAQQDQIAEMRRAQARVNRGQ